MSSVLGLSPAEPVQRVRPLDRSMAAIGAPWGRMRPDTPFQSWTWAGAWWDAFGAGLEPYALQVENSAGQCTGLLPLYRGAMQRPVWPRLRELRLIGAGSGDSEGLDVLATTEAADAVAGAALDWLASHPREWDVLALDEVCAESPRLRAFHRAAAARRWPHRLVHSPRLLVDLSGGWEALLSRLSASRRQTLLYQAKRIEQSDDWTLVRPEGGAVVATVEALFALHDRRWQAQGKPGNFADPRRRRFYARLAPALAAEGLLDLWRLDHRGAPVAVHFGMRYRGVHSYLDGGFDVELASFSPGTVLTTLVMRALAANGVETFDFLGGDDDYKHGWAPRMARYATLRLARPRSAGALRLRAESLARGFRALGTR